jgi:hypothetical protein
MLAYQRDVVLLAAVYIVAMAAFADTVVRVLFSGPRKPDLYV